MTVVAADSLQLGMIEETSRGITPTTPAFDLVRLTGETLTFETNVSESAELAGAGRFQKPGNVTGISVSGDISGVAAPAPWLDAAIEGVLAEDWGECPLTGASGGAIDDTDRVTVGQEMRSYTIEKRFPNPANVAGAMPIAAAAGASGSQTVDITYSGGATTGSGVSVINVTVNGISYSYSVPISPTDDETDVATAAAVIVNAGSGPTATSALGVLTIDAGAGNTIESVSARAGADDYVYQRYIGCTFSTMTTSITPNEDVTMSFGVISGVPILDDLPLDGATYVGAGDNPVFTAPDVIELTIGSMAVGTSCFTSLEITLDSQNRGIACIGSKGERNAVLGTLACTLDGEVYFSGSQELLQAVINNEVIGDSVITLVNADDAVLRFDAFLVKANSATLNAESAGADLTIPVTLQPTPVVVCSDNGNDWSSGLIISKKNVAPTLP